MTRFTDDQITKAAKAMRAVYQGAVEADDWDDISEALRRHWRDKARAGLETLPEPAPALWQEIDTGGNIIGAIYGLPEGARWRAEDIEGDRAFEAVAFDGQTVAFAVSRAMCLLVDPSTMPRPLHVRIYDRLTVEGDGELTVEQVRDALEAEGVTL